MTITPALRRLTRIALLTLALAACTRPAPGGPTFPTLPPPLATNTAAAATDLPLEVTTAAPATVTESAPPSATAASETRAATDSPLQPSATPSQITAPTATGTATAEPTAAPTDTPPAPTSAPATSTHVVQQGETLFRIATRYGITVDELRAANGITGDLIFAGQTLTIPAGAFTPTPGAAG